MPPTSDHKSDETRSEEHTSKALVSRGGRPSTTLPTTVASFTNTQWDGDTIPRGPPFHMRLEANVMGTRVAPFREVVQRLRKLRRGGVARGLGHPKTVLGYPPNESCTWRGPRSYSPTRCNTGRELKTWKKGTHGCWRTTTKKGRIFMVGKFPCLLLNWDNIIFICDGIIGFCDSKKLVAIENTLVVIGNSFFLISHIVFT